MEGTELKKTAVYVPVHNNEKYVDACLDSIVAQTYPNMQIIIADDASVDLSLDICREYEHKDPRVKIISYPEAHGSCGPINESLKDVDAEFVCKMDADDLMAEKYWETVLPLFTSPQIGFVSIGMMFTNASGVCSVRTYPPQRIQNPIDIFTTNPIYAASPFRMEMFKQVGGWDIGHLHPDWDFWIRCILNKWEWAYCFRPMYFYRKHPNSMLSSSSNDKKREAREYYKKKYEKDMDKLGLRPAPSNSNALGIPKIGVLNP